MEKSTWSRNFKIKDKVIQYITEPMCCEFEFFEKVITEKVITEKVIKSYTNYKVII